MNRYIPSLYSHRVKRKLKDAFDTPSSPFPYAQSIHPQSKKNIEHSHVTRPSNPLPPTPHPNLFMRELDPGGRGKDMVGKVLGKVRTRITRENLTGSKTPVSASEPQLPNFTILHHGRKKKDCSPQCV